MTDTIFETQSPVRADARLAEPSWLTAFLRFPLLGKLIGANAILFASALAIHRLFPDASLVVQAWIFLTLSFTITGVLTWLALRPIADLEATAERVSLGDFGARVPESVLADSDVRGLATTMNRLLTRVEADRARIQYLAGRSVRAREIERETVARELRDSLAQTVAAIGMQLSATQRVNRDPEVQQQLERSRVMIEQLSDDMRSVAEALYPGTIGEFGLCNALQALARRASRMSATPIEVDCELPDGQPLAAQTASALYRVADEALRNVAQHSGARQARARLRADGGSVVLEVEDDGRGIDMYAGDPLQAGLGLFSAKSLLALAGGELQISSGSELGTRVVARVPAHTTNGAQ